jgi:hypothetical protein
MYNNFSMLDYPNHKLFQTIFGFFYNLKMTNIDSKVYYLPKLDAPYPLSTKLCETC